MKKIIVSVTNDLVTDQRVHKVCMTLHDAGYEVLLVGRKLRTSETLSRVYQTRRMRLIFNKKAFFYIEYNLRLFSYLLLARADIFLSNDTDSLPANYCASVFRKKPLIFDAHEMFPEVPELVSRPLIKNIWKKIEDWIFPHLKYCYTVCSSIADIYKERYGIRMQVVRNVPFAAIPQNHATINLATDGKKILLYQGAVNVGRGIEWMIEAMPYLDDCIFYIIGNGDVMREMQEKVKKLELTNKVRFLGKVPLEDLAAYTALADIGLVLLENKSLNYYYSLPNRIFDFIQANVPILASDFPEIRKIITEYPVGKLIQDYAPQQLATSIREILSNSEHFCFTKANIDFTWEKESKIILEILENISLDTAKKSHAITVEQ